MTARVPDAAGLWWWGDPDQPKFAVVYKLDMRDDGLGLYNAQGKRERLIEFNQMMASYAPECRWLGPVAPPVGEGEVLVKLQREDAERLWRDRVQLINHWKRIQRETDEHEAWSLEAMKEEYGFDEADVAGWDREEEALRTALEQS